MAQPLKIILISVYWKYLCFTELTSRHVEVNVDVKVMDVKKIITCTSSLSSFLDFLGGFLLQAR